MRSIELSVQLQHITLASVTISGTIIADRLHRLFVTRHARLAHAVIALVELFLVLCSLVIFVIVTQLFFIDLPIRPLPTPPHPLLSPAIMLLGLRHRTTLSSHALALSREILPVYYSVTFITTLVYFRSFAQFSAAGRRTSTAATAAACLQVFDSFGHFAAHPMSHCHNTPVSAGGMCIIDGR